MAAQAGDRQAFATLVETASPAALRIAGAILHSPTEAQDAVQDAFVRAWLDLPKLRDPERWPAWFHALTVHAALDRIRHRHRVRELALDRASALSEGDASAAGADRDQVRRVVRALSLEDQVILVLRFAEDLEVPSIAEILGVPLGTAKARLHRALERVRIALGTEP